MRRIAFALAIVLGCTAGFFTTNGCGSTQVGLPKASLSGQVIDAVTHAPLAGVQVDIRGRQAITDRNGRYSFTELGTNLAMIAFSKRGYFTFEREITLAAGNNTLDIPMRPVP